MGEQGLVHPQNKEVHNDRDVPGGRGRDGRPGAGMFTALLSARASFSPKESGRIRHFMCLTEILAMIFISFFKSLYL